MAKRGRWTAREEEMRAVLGRWSRSGLPLAQFARREGIAQKTMYRWRRRLGVGEGQVRRGRPRGAATGAATSMFTEVNPAVRRASSATMFEVVLGDGTKVRVPRQFDADSLRALLVTLRGC